MPNAYVHGYSPQEASRLTDQALTLRELLHWDTAFAQGRRVLEAGCGAGSQTVALRRNSPGADMIAVDIDAGSLERAARLVADADGGPVEFKQADIMSLPFQDQSFDDVFVCFVLEHLSDPPAALRELARVLKPGGTITVIEGDHGSTLFHPEAPEAGDVIACQIELQRRAGGDALIGRRVGPLVAQAGFEAVQVSPRMVFVDQSRPDLADGFIRKTFTSMVAAVEADAIAAGLIDGKRFKAGVEALLRTAEPDGVFGYTFFKATAVKPTR